MQTEDQVPGGKKLTIQDFMNNNKQFDTFEYRLDWNGYKVYEVWRKSEEGTCVGYPQYALEKNEKIRESKLEETIQIMHSFPDDDEETD